MNRANYHVYMDFTRKSLVINVFFLKWSHHRDLRPAFNITNVACRYLHFDGIHPTQTSSRPFASDGFLVGDSGVEPLSPQCH